MLARSCATMLVSGAVQVSATDQAALAERDREQGCVLGLSVLGTIMQG